MKMIRNAWETYKGEVSLKKDLKVLGEAYYEKCTRVMEEIEEMIKTEPTSCQHTFVAYIIGELVMGFDEKRDREIILNMVKKAIEGDKYE